MQMKRIAGANGLVFVALIAIITVAQGAAGRPFGDPGNEGYLDDAIER